MAVQYTVYPNLIISTVNYSYYMTSSVCVVIAVTTKAFILCILVLGLACTSHRASTESLLELYKTLFGYGTSLTAINFRKNLSERYPSGFGIEGSTVQGLRGPTSLHWNIRSSTLVSRHKKGTTTACDPDVTPGYRIAAWRHSRRRRWRQLFYEIK